MGNAWGSLGRASGSDDPGREADQGEQRGPGPASHAQDVAGRDGGADSRPPRVGKGPYWVRQFDFADFLAYVLSSVAANVGGVDWLSPGDTSPWGAASQVPGLPTTD